MSARIPDARLAEFVADCVAAPDDDVVCLPNAQLEAILREVQRLRPIRNAAWDFVDEAGFLPPIETRLASYQRLVDAVKVDFWDGDADGR